MQAVWNASVKLLYFLDLSTCIFTTVAIKKNAPIKHFEITYGYILTDY